MARLIKCALWLYLAAASDQLRAQEQTVAEPLAAADAAQTATVPAGFQVTLFAGEPHVKQPISFCFDDRGRLWVAEAYNYPNHGTRPGDRVIILEDTDGDGQFDNRRVFYDQLNYVTGIEYGFGGLFVMTPPFFYFIPDRNGDDLPDAEPKLLLDGWGNHANSHNLANALAFGPDGWLYGTHGRTNWSLPGKPGTPMADRTQFDGGVWRYHPIKDVWEPYADGSTNPWGIDWNDVGEPFVCNCVTPHLFHVIQGAHYEPWRNRASSQFAYERISSIADHLHFVGVGNVRDGLGSHAEDEAGGGHAHCGTMVYLGDNWPAEYRNQVFMNNLHGKRVNQDLPERHGSGYLARHGQDVVRFKDPWHMGVTLRYGPEGAVYLSDWSDTGECHSVVNTRRETGRIFRIAYGKPAQFAGDVSQLSDEQLVQMQLHANDWFVQHARRVLQERAAAGQLSPSTHRLLRQQFAEQDSIPKKLRALWALHVTDGLDQSLLLQLTQHTDEYLRGWAVKLLCEQSPPPAEVVSAMLDLAKGPCSPLDRLTLSSQMQRLAPSDRWELAESLAAHAEDADDDNLPLMLWYAVEPLVHADLKRFVTLGGTAKIPQLRQYIARRAVSLPARGGALELLLQTAAACPADAQQDLLEGILQGIEGERSLPMPEHWPAAYAAFGLNEHAELQSKAVRLALVFDDPVALTQILNQASNTALPAGTRNAAIAALVAKRVPDLSKLLLELVADEDTRQAAVRGLAEYDDLATASTLLAAYPQWDPAARQDTLQTLASRAAWAEQLLAAVEQNRIPRQDLTAFTARQLLNLGSEPISARVKALWGDLRPTAEDRARAIAEYKAKLTPELLTQGNAQAGRAVFQKACANCHRLFDAGGKIGPDITGAQRKNLDYLLENLVDPSGAVSRDYQMTILETTTGRVITGLLASTSENAVTVQTANEQVVVPIDEIVNRQVANVSMMPDGLLKPMTLEQVRDLLVYLSGSGQVPPAE